MIFWISVFLSLLCILKTKPERQISRWDILFFLSSWQMFNLGTWQNYLNTAQITDPYRVASLLCILLTITYLLRRDIKISLEISPEAMKECMLWTGILIGILIPIGFYIGFLRWNPKLSPFGRSLAGGEINFLKTTLIDYFVFVAIIEELVFRGLIFNLLKRVFHVAIALTITTLLFATIFSHITGGGNFPNWPYVGMAFIAGTAYGISYYRTNNLLVPILLHGTVDSVWRIFFS